MVHIACLQEPQKFQAMFASEHLERLRTMATVSINVNSGPVQVETAKALMRDADLIVTSWGCPRLTTELLAESPRLKAIFHAGGSVKEVVSEEVWRKGIRVCAAADALGIGVAESALGLTISALKDMWRLRDGMREGRWGARNRIKELYGITIGVVGAGKAGRHYIRLLQGFDVRVLLYDPYITAEEAERIGAVKCHFEQLLSASDVISIHAPSLPETYRMFRKQTFRLMKDECVLINTARGALIDEDDLVRELSKGRFFACLDVTCPEPAAKDHPFRTLPNVVLLPHIAGAVQNGLGRVAQSIVDDIGRFLNGEPVAGEVRSEMFGILA